ncbi:P-type cation-transporting ATPase [Pseudocercospora fuligena]|uniref:P-type cation-transporting ATPase n=1 Tax=Pseudocercospora fuligena TaxID=685502 RepID=A0A8H6VGH2_9PEZI|nr:P-type cation-transporting ATPase [Pseudocercospora fuligena]
MEEQSCSKSYEITGSGCKDVPSQGGQRRFRSASPVPISQKPCSGHLSEARKKYGSVLRAMNCMCKTLIAQGRESCCTIRRRQTTAAATRSEAAGYSSQVSDKNEKACSSGVEVKKACCNKRENRVKVEKTCENTRVAVAENCCSARQTDDKGCKYAESTSDNLAYKPVHTPRDVELGFDRLEHIVLSVQGMTCTGCETKLARSIANIPSAVNGKTSIVLSRAEFDIDPSVISHENAISQLATTTGFVLSKIEQSGHVLQIRATGDSQQILGQSPPLGVLNVTPKGKNIICISYDPAIVGARSLVEHAFGRKLELALIAAPDNIAAGARHVREVGLKTVLSSVLTIPVLILAWAPLAEHEVAYQSASLALATVVQVVVAGPFYTSALRSLIFSRVIEMDMLVVLSTTAAYVFSIVAYAYLMVGKPLSTGSFFESSTLLVTLIMLGRFISALARQKAVESISVTSLQPPMATLLLHLDDDEFRTRDIDARLLHYGDTILVTPDSKIATDGTVVSGNSDVDESMITGESHPVVKSTGSAAIAGTVNGSGALHVRVTRLLGDNTVSSIAEMVDQAKLTKPKIQEFADRVAGYFVPVIVVITILVFCIWIGVNVGQRHLSGSDAAVRAITYAIAVLIVSCPCAIGLAVPMVVVIACGVGAEHGIIFKSAQSIESAWKATHIVFDKTGTLTLGAPTVVEEKFLGKIDDQHDLEVLLLLATANKHPVSTALAAHLQDRFGSPANVLDVKILAGQGVTAEKDNRTYRLGNATWLEMENLPEVQAMRARNLTVACFATSDEPRAIFGLKDSLRADAPSVIPKLLAKDITLFLLSGDEEGAVSEVASELGIPSSNVKARCSPQDKQSYIQNLTEDNRNVVVFCGDGSNDAAALAQATIGVHMSTGTDIARSASDAVLMRPNLASLLTLMEISQATHRRIVANFVWAFTYNLFAILLAAGAFVNARIPPQYAGLGEVVSVLPVIAVALQMKWIKF